MSDTERRLTLKEQADSLRRMNIVQQAAIEHLDGRLKVLQQKLEFESVQLTHERRVFEHKRDELMDALQRKTKLNRKLIEALALMKTPAYRLDVTKKEM